MCDIKTAKCLIKDNLPYLTLKLYERLQRLPYFITLPDRLKSDFECYYRNRLDTYIERHRTKYKLPIYMAEDFDPIDDFYFRFIQNMEPFVMKMAKRDMDKLKREVTIEELSENQIDRLSAEETTMEENTLNIITQEKIDNLNKEFMRFLNTLEKKVFIGMREELTARETIDFIGETRSGQALSIQQLRSIRNKIEFRVLCWCAVFDLFSVEITLRLFNKHPNLCSRYFGRPILIAIPEVEKMKMVAKGDDMKMPVFFHDEPRHSIEEIERRAMDAFGPITENTSDSAPWVFCAKFYNGKKYDHPVVYINRSGHCYSHVDKRTWSLFEGETA